MAIIRYNRYPGRFASATANYPQGAFKNKSSPDAKDGSYAEADWLNDWDGFFGRLMTTAGISANGAVDNALSSQYYDALMSLVLQKSQVGNDVKQIPDMSFFESDKSGNNFYSFSPNGMLRQGGLVTLAPVQNYNPQTVGGVTYYTHYYRIPFNIAFPSKQVSTVATLACSSFTSQSGMAGKSVSIHRDDDGSGDVSKTRFTIAITTTVLGYVPVVHWLSEGY